MNDKSLKQKEQSRGYRRATIIKNILYNYERILQKLTLEELLTIEQEEENGNII
jgi:hypothetical protein